MSDGYGRMQRSVPLFTILNRALVTVKAKVETISGRVDDAV